MGRRRRGGVHQGPRPRLLDSVGRVRRAFVWGSCRAPARSVRSSAPARPCPARRLPRRTTPSTSTPGAPGVPRFSRAGAAVLFLLVHAYVCARVRVCLLALSETVGRRVSGTGNEKSGSGMTFDARKQAPPKLRKPGPAPGEKKGKARYKHVRREEEGFGAVLGRAAQLKATAATGKRPMSKAERKRAKKASQPSAGPEPAEAPAFVGPMRPAPRGEREAPRQELWEEQDAEQDAEPDAEPAPTVAARPTSKAERKQAKKKNPYALAAKERRHAQKRKKQKLGTAQDRAEPSAAKRPEAGFAPRPKAPTTNMYNASTAALQAAAVGGKPRRGVAAKPKKKKKYGTRPGRNVGRSA